VNSFQSAADSARFKAAWRVPTPFTSGRLLSGVLICVDHAVACWNAAFAAANAFARSAESVAAACLAFSRSACSRRVRACVRYSISRWLASRRWRAR